MKIYLVGGAVRDKLLGLPVQERDWVVVGATEQDMKKQGYQRVGKQFPVFLHPKTHEEYALARLEKKVSPGYQGFTFDTSPLVTLADDLRRRDLTINAMAETPDGRLIDPYHGYDDLKTKILRHTSPAFNEDPVRILRVGRLLARYAYLAFHVAPETMQLMREMVNRGEVDALVAERVWKELERALKEKNPEQFFQVLSDCHALPRLFPTITAKGPGIEALIAATTLTKQASIRFAALLHVASKEAIIALCTRYRAPRIYRELALLVAKHYSTILIAKTLTPSALLSLLLAVDCLRRYDRFKACLKTTQAIAIASKKSFDINWLNECTTIVRHVTATPYLAQGLSGEALAHTLYTERLTQLTAFIDHKHP